MKRKFFKVTACLIMITLLIGMVTFHAASNEAASKPKISKTSANILVGKTMQLKVANLSKNMITSWSTANKKIAKVTSSGKVKAVNKGKTIIYCKVKVLNKTITLTCRVTAIKGASKIAILDDNSKAISTHRLMTEEIYQLKVAKSPTSSNDKIKWTSSKPKIVKVSSSGELKALQEGSATITVISLSKKKASVVITVSDSVEIVTPAPMPVPTAAPAATDAPVAPTSAPTMTPTSTPTPVTLKDSLYLAYAKYFKIGTAVSGYQLSDATTVSNITKQYNSITMENEMKPSAILGVWTPTLIEKDLAEFPVPETYLEVNVPQLDFSTVDRMLAIAQAKGLKMRGHTLIWHSQTPSWFFRKGYSPTGALVSPTVMNARMEYYIQQVLLHCQEKYPGVIYCWDVCNEIFSNSDGSLRSAGSNWYNIYKSDTFAVNAFAYARKYAASDVKLFYNDYNEYIYEKTEGIYNLVSKIKKLGNIDGVGMQSHYDIGYPSAFNIKETIDRFTSISPDLEIHLTEIDATCAGTSDFSNQAAYYKSLFTMLVKAKKAGTNITSVTFWGLYDTVSWRGGMAYDKVNRYPLLFESSFATPKLSYYAVLEAAY